LIGKIKLNNNTDIFLNDRRFKEAIGGFIIAFSEVEFGLGMICAMAAPDPRDRDISEALSMSLSQKRKQIGKYIRNNLPQLEKVWGEINNEIGELNEIRRFLTHGHLQYPVPHEQISPIIMKNKKPVQKKISVDEIEKWTDRLHHLISGKYGVQGEFEIMFSTARINLWNKSVGGGERMEYRINGKLMTKWSKQANN
jgi:hypothetical protein